MPSNDVVEWLQLMLSLPLAALLVFFRLITALYVYIDAEQRSKNRLMAVGFTLMVTLFYWPIGFFAYLACTALIDRVPRKANVEASAKS